MFYAKELIFMDTSQKLEMIRLLGDSGGLYENEKRVAFGYMPLAELEGVRMMSKNYGTVDSVQNMDKNAQTQPEEPDEPEPEEPAQEGNDPDKTQGDGGVSNE